MKKPIITLLIMTGLMVWAFPQSTAEQSLRRYLVSPDFLRRHQGELEITEDQRSFIIQEINRTQTEFNTAKWKLQEEIGRLSTLVRDNTGSEEEILGQLDVVLDLEKEIKRLQLRLAVRIKNTLSEEQLATLRKIRAREALKTRIQNQPLRPRPRR